MPVQKYLQHSYMVGIWVYTLGGKMQTEGLLDQSTESYS